MQDTFLTQTKDCIYVVAKGNLDYAIPCEPEITKVEFLNENRPVSFTQTADGIMITEEAKTTEESSVFKLYKQL